MEQEAPKTNDQIADEANQEDGIMSVSDTAGNASICQVDEGEVRKRVDNFSGIGCRVVVLKIDYWVSQPVIHCFYAPSHSPLRTN